MTYQWTGDVAHQWMDDALCIGVDPELFFPDGVSEEQSAAREKAKAICGWCPVRVQCLEFAVATPWVQYGIWGGVSTAEVRRSAGRQRTGRQPRGPGVRT